MQNVGFCRRLCCLVLLAATMTYAGLVWFQEGMTVKASQAEQIDIGSDTQIASRIGMKNYSFYPDGVEPDPALYYGETALVRDQDYTVEYQDNTAVGTATAMVTGLGAYKGQLALKYEIVPAELAAANLTLDPSLIEETGAPLTLADLKGTLFYVASDKDRIHALIEGKDYKVVGYGENVGPGTAKMTVGGLGNYTGIATVTFTIYKQNDVSDKNTMAMDIKDAQVTFSNIQDYAGKPVIPDLRVTYNGRDLVEGLDYKLEVSNNMGPGTASFKVTGIGSYGGEKTGTFEIIDG